jgi:hypothetical protein
VRRLKELARKPRGESEYILLAGSKNNKVGKLNLELRNDREMKV